MKVVQKSPRFRAVDVVVTVVGIVLITEGLYIACIAAWTTVHKLGGDYPYRAVFLARWS